MTNEEAIEQLKINTGKEPLTISGSATRMAEYFKALAIASEALEKQVAKKPRYTTIFEGEKAEKLKAKNLPNFEIYKCPICNNSVAERTFATSLHPGGFIKDNYCRNCGKKMDWSKDELSPEDKQAGEYADNEVLKSAT